VFDAIRELMTPPEPKKRKIGFLVKERAAGTEERKASIPCGFVKLPWQRSTNRVEFGSLRTLCSEINPLA